MSFQFAPISKPVGEGQAPPLLVSAFAKKKRIVIPREATEGSDLVGRNLLFGSDAEVAASYWEGFVALAGVATGSGFFCEAAFPTVKYLRIFSSLLGPMPRIARKSSTLLNGPYDFRICKIFSAVTGPIPGTSCSSSEFAVLMLTGATGGFFLAKSGTGNREQMANRKTARLITGLCITDE